MELQNYINTVIERMESLGYQEHKMAEQLYRPARDHWDDEVTLETCLENEYNTGATVDSVVFRLRLMLN